MRRQMTVVAAVRSTMSRRGTVLTNRAFRVALVREAQRLKRCSAPEQGGAGDPAPHGRRVQGPALPLLATLRKRSSSRSFSEAAGDWCLGGLCCKRRAVGYADCRIRYVVGGVGHVVHGFCLERADGTRVGKFLEDNKTEIDIRDTAALRRRKAKWYDVYPDEFIISVQGNQNTFGYLAAEKFAAGGRGGG